jgi:hypothetical protein
LGAVSGVIVRAGPRCLQSREEPDDENHHDSEDRTMTGVIRLLTLALAITGATGRAPSGLVYSTASGHVVQRQPAAGSCHALGRGLYSRPDPHCTPGVLNPAVTQATITSTVCRSGWTSTVRPPRSITEPEKLASMAAYNLRGSASLYEYDHYVPLELGGALNDPRNLWPEPDYATRSGFYLNPKDRLENALKRMVCRNATTLAQAQRLIAFNWVAAYNQLHIGGYAGVGTDSRASETRFASSSAMFSPIESISGRASKSPSRPKFMCPL